MANNVMGRNGNTSGKMGYADNYDNDADAGSSNGGRNGRRGKNQIHEKGNTDNGNPGENMLNAGSLKSHTEYVREQVGTGGLSDSRRTKKDSGVIESHNTTAPETAKP